MSLQTKPFGTAYTVIDIRKGHSISENVGSCSKMPQKLTSSDMLPAATYSNGSRPLLSKFEVKLDLDDPEKDIITAYPSGISYGREEFAEIYHIILPGPFLRKWAKCAIVDFEHRSYTVYRLDGTPSVYDGDQARPLLRAIRLN